MACFNFLVLAPDAECSKFCNSLFFGVLEAYSWNKMNYNQAMKNGMGLGVFSCVPFLFEVTRGFWKMWWIILQYKSWVTFSCREIDDRFAATGILFSMISTDFSTKFSMGFSSMTFDKISDGTVISGISGVLAVSSISFLSSSHFFLATRKCANSLSWLDTCQK